MLVLNAFKPLRNDDVIWGYAADGLLAHGWRPLIEYGGGFRNWALWHPPLFVYELGASLALFGRHAISLRVTGMLGAATAAVFAWLLLRQAGLGARWRALGFGLLCAQAWIQGWLIPDIDGALLVPLLTGLAICQWRGLETDRFPLGTAVFCWMGLFLAKWTTPPLVLVTWALFLLWSRGWRTAFRQAILSAALGLALAMLAYGLYAVVAGINPLYPFEFSFQVKAAGTHFTLSERLQSLRWGFGTVVGLGLPVAAIGSWLGLKPGLRRKSTSLFLVLGLMLPLAYALLLPGLGYQVLTWKYVAPTGIYLAITLALGWDGIDATGLNGQGARRAALLWMASVIFLLATQHYHRWYPSRLDIFYLLLLLLLLWVLGQDGLTWSKRLLWAGLLTAALQAGVYAGVLSKEGPDCSPSFPTGERGFAALIQSPPPELARGLVLCRKDVGYYVARDRVIPIDPHFGSPPLGIQIPLSKRPLAQSFAQLWPWPVTDWNLYTTFEQASVDDPPGLLTAIQRASAVVDSDYDSFLKDPKMQTAVETRFPRRLHFGDYSVYLPAQISSVKTKEEP